MSHAATAYKSASMLSEEPSLSWVIRGIRGVNTYVASATQACKNGDVQARAEAVAKASALLAFLEGIAADGEAAELGNSLRSLYVGFQVRLTEAHAAASETAFSGLGNDIRALAADMARVATNASEES